LSDITYFIEFLEIPIYNAKLRLKKWRKDRVDDALIRVDTYMQTIDDYEKCENKETILKPTDYYRYLRSRRKLSHSSVDHVPERSVESVIVAATDPTWLVTT